MDPWIKAWSDPLASLRSNTSCLHLADLDGTGEFHLIVADIRKKVVVYRGNHIAWENVLPDIPVAVAIHYPDTSGVPSLAVASGAHIFIYRNSRPYFKFTLPSMEIHREEMQI